MNFRERLKDLRKERGLSLRQLAKQIGYGPAYISRVENNLHPSEKLVRALAEEFKDSGGLDLFYLAGMVIPPDFQEGTSFERRQKLFPRGPEDDAILDGLYPDKDPFEEYDGYNSKSFPDILHALKDPEYREYLWDHGVDQSIISIFPPLRKLLIANIILAQQTELLEKYELTDIQDVCKIAGIDIEAELKKYEHRYRLEGVQDGIRLALSTLKDVLQGQGDYYLQAAFYPPQVARAIADFLAILKRTNLPNED